MFQCLCVEFFWAFVCCGMCGAVFLDQRVEQPTSAASAATATSAAASAAASGATTTSGAMQHASPLAAITPAIAQHEGRIRYGASITRAI